MFNIPPETEYLMELILTVRRVYFMVKSVHLTAQTLLILNFVGKKYQKSLTNAFVEKRIGMLQIYIWISGDIYSQISQDIQYTYKLYNKLKKYLC